MLNRVDIIGHLGRDPETRFTAAGDPICHLSVATTEHWTSRANGQRQERTEWHRVTFFGRLAEVATQYLVKGSRLYVSGRLATRDYTDRDGIKRYSTEIQGSQLRLLDRADHANHDAGGARPAAGQRAAANFDDMTDDIPF